MKKIFISLVAVSILSCRVKYINEFENANQNIRKSSRTAEKIDSLIIDYFIKTKPRKQIYISKENLSLKTQKDFSDKVIFLGQGEVFKKHFLKPTRFYRFYKNKYDTGSTLIEKKVLVQFVTKDGNSFEDKYSIFVYAGFDKENNRIEQMVLSYGADFVIYEPNCTKCPYKIDDYNKLKIKIPR